MYDFDYDDNSGLLILLIGLSAAALSGAFVGLVAGAIGANLAFMTLGCIMKRAAAAISAATAVL